MNIKLSILALTLLVLLLLPSCGKEPSLPTGVDTEDTAQEAISPALLTKTEDMGQAYLDSFIFLGESTTYHLKSRGVLSGGTQTRQVWGPDSGTILLDSTTPTVKIRYPDTGEYLTVGEAAARKKPRYLMMTFGLNGAVQNVKRGADYYKSCYRALIDAVRESSPETTVILQSCFPVASNMDMTYYSVTLDELNEHIETLNAWALELAEEYGLYYLNTSEILTDGQGRLKLEYQNGDGHHLTREAYRVILDYIRTHGCK